MFSLEKLQTEVDQLISLNKQFPNVIQKQKIKRILDSWENIKAFPEKHEGTSSVDIFKRDLKGCITLLEGKNSMQHTHVDSGADMNNLQARMARLNPNVQPTPEPTPEPMLISDSINIEQPLNDPKTAFSNKELLLAQDVKQKYEIAFKAMVEGGSTDTELMKEQSIIIKALEALIANLK